MDQLDELNRAAQEIHGDEVDRLTRSRMAEMGEGYAQALVTVARDNPRPVELVISPPDPAREGLDRKARAIQRQSGKSYRESLLEAGQEGLP